MDDKVIKAKLKEVLTQIQELSGESCPPLEDGVRPAEALPNFTSKVWPVAAGMLGVALGKSIPCEVNIFVEQGSKRPLAISETVALVCKIIDKQDEEKAKKAA